MALRERVREASRWLADAIYVPMCAECNRRGSWVCAECRARVLPLTAPGCARCGVAKPWDCECERIPAEIDRLRSAYPYAGWVRSSIHRFKYDGEFARGEELAAELDRIRGELDPVELIVPVPIHSRRLRERGFNQSALLARHLSLSWGIACAELLERRLDSPRQVGKSGDERWRNVSGAFACANRAAVAGMRIAVLDDVITTGATISSCAVALVASGAKSVVGLSVARG